MFKRILKIITFIIMHFVIIENAAYRLNIENIFIDNPLQRSVNH